MIVDHVVSHPAHDDAEIAREPTLPRQAVREPLDAIVDDDAALGAAVWVE